MSAALHKCLRGSPAERRLKAAAQQAPDSFSPPSATPPIGPLTVCCERAAVLYSIVWPELKCQRKLTLRRQPRSSRFPRLQ
jgi:hypothetical protein